MAEKDDKTLVDTVMEARQKNLDEKKATAAPGGLFDLLFRRRKALENQYDQINAAGAVRG